MAQETNNSEGAVRNAARFTESEARTLLWTQILEEESIKSGKADIADFKALTSEAAREVGESSSVSNFLSARSDKVLHFLAGRLGLNVREPKAAPFFAIGATTAFLAFVLGALTNELAGSSGRINLLSPPLLGVIAWNILVYCWIAAAVLFSKGLFPFGPIRKALFYLIEKIETKGSAKNKFLRLFYSKWADKEPKLNRLYCGEVLHTAALLFTLGLMASVALHGWSTSYRAGWESTWLSENPEAVASVLKLFYGLVPAGDLTENLTAQTVAAMNFDAGGGVSAAPWLIRIFYVLGAVVLAPRALLIFLNAVRIRSLRSNFPVALSGIYYSNILRQWKGKTMQIEVIPFSYPLSETLRDGLKKLTDTLHPEITGLKFHEAAHEDSRLPDLQGSQDSEVLIIFAMTATPEAEVQGAFVAEVKKTLEPGKNTLRILIDTSGFEARFASNAQRIKERRRTWSDFLDSYGLPYAFVNLMRPDATAVAAAFDTH